MSRENILLIGCTSKLGRLFYETYKDEYNFYGTYASTPPRQEDAYKEVFHLDLSDIKSVGHFIEQTAHIPFRAVLFLASAYCEDKEENADFLEQLIAEHQVVSLSPVVIARGLSYAAPMGRVIFFGDAGLLQPKRHFVSYSLSKASLEQTVRSLAVELSDRALCLAFRLGPTFVSDGSNNKDEYYAKNLITVRNVPHGLVKYLHFIINEADLNATGTIIDYDGGTYLRRAGAK